MKQITRTIDNRKPKPKVLPTISLAEIIPWAGSAWVWVSTATILLPVSSFLIFKNRLVVRVLEGTPWPSKIQLDKMPDIMTVFREPIELPHVLLCIKGDAEHPMAGVVGLIEVTQHPRRGDNFSAYVLKSGKLPGYWAGNYDTSDAAREKILNAA